MTDRFKFRAWIPKLATFADWFDVRDDIFRAGMRLKSDSIEVFYYPDIILMQCTGLKDKNDKLIYEGDILNDKYSIAAVKFDDARYYWGGGEDWGEIDAPRVEVIGNIYENAEPLR